MIGFKVYWSTYEKLVATVIINEGKPFLEYACNEGVMQDFERIITYGLNQWIGEPGDRRPRMTKPDHPLFLQRFADYLSVIYGFAISEIESCCVHFGSSRMCERGTKSCEIHHKDTMPHCRVCMIEKKKDK